MTPEAQRIAIATACGLKNLRMVYKPLYGDQLCHGNETMVPAYLSDLNAMHEAENALTDEQHNKFKEHLATLAGCKEGRRDSTPGWRRRYVSAPAAQRALAFLRTLNLWTP